MESTKYNHLYDIGFSVTTEIADGFDLIARRPDMIRNALVNRIASLTDDELVEAIGLCDTYEEE